MDLDYKATLRTIIRALRDGYGVEDIAVRQGIHADYVREIVLKLRKNNWLKDIYRDVKYGPNARALIAP